MSQTENVPGGFTEGGDSPGANLPRLAELARQAYERKDAKNCLDLTRAMLLIDPENADAQWMRSAIQSEMQRDLENARTFLRQAHSKEFSDKAAESTDVPIASDIPIPTPSQSEEVESPVLAQADEVSLPALEVVAPAQSKRMLVTLWLVVASVPVVIALGVIAVRLPALRNRSHPQSQGGAANTGDRPMAIAKTNSEQPDLLLLAHSAGAETAPLSISAPSPNVVSSVPATASTSSPGPVSNAVSVPVAAPGITARPPAPKPPGSRLASKTPDVVVVPDATGILAVSSPTSVDIYKDNVYLGSVPISLELPPGSHTLEYRHGNLRRSITHIINSNETTKAMITFDIAVQINCRPWAEVFIEAAERKDLGQTPLSGVRVPIGSVLSFENPRFPAKKYRVTGNETGIQIVFP
jgi:hypothetical protein